MLYVRVHNRGFCACSIHGGAGAILSVGLMQRVPLKFMEDCMSGMTGTGKSSLPCIALPQHAPPHPALPRAALPCLAQSCPALPRPALPCPAMCVTCAGKPGT